MHTSTPPLKKVLCAFFCVLSLPVIVCAAPGDPDDALTIFGSRPIFTNGGKSNVIVDDFAWIDDTLLDQRQAHIAAAIDEWNLGGIGYAAYFALGTVESEAGAAALGDAGKRIDLDGSVNNWFMFTRSAFRAYLVAAGKTATDLGANYFLLDNASPNLETLSFDAEILAEFRTYLSGNYTTGELTAMGVSDVGTFDYAVYLKSAEGGNYTNTSSLDASAPSNDLWRAWKENLEAVERAFFEEWTSSIKTYAQTEYSRTVYFGANRYTVARQWDNIDKMDFGMAETFLDTLGYPYHNLDHVYKNVRNFDKRFWSWNFPSNTGKFNGSNDSFGGLHITELSKVFTAETFASGGLHQTPIDWVSYYGSDQRLSPLAPYYEFARSHSELFNLDEAGEVAVLYNEAYEISDTGGYTPGYRGIMMLLGDEHRSFDVLFAGDPDKRDGFDPFASADLSGYKAIVLPRSRMLTDTQVAKLESYLNGGGAVIGLGEIATQDEDGNDVSGARTFDDYFASDGSTGVGLGVAVSITTNLGDSYHGNAATSASEGEWEVTAGNLTSLTGFQSTWSAAVDSHVSKDFSTLLSRLAHIHRYEDSADGSHVYQIVNRDINLTSNVDDQTMNATAAVASSVAIPVGFTSGTVKLSWVTVESPTPVDLAFTANGDSVDFTLPSFSIWGILKVGSVAASPSAVDETPESNFNLETDTGGKRPDTFDSDGKIEYNYWYWKGGNHGTVPWDIPYWASDDNEVDLVRLYYRYSTDSLSWGDWTLDSSTDVTGKNVSGVLSFGAPSGEGHYQLRIQAVDGAGQEEIVDTTRDENGYGVDETATSPPTNVTEASNVTGTWIPDPSSLVFSWDEPQDNLSGHSAANVTLASDSVNVTDANLSADTHTWSPSLSGLVDGERYKLVYQNEDEAGNWASSSTLFTFRYGMLPVVDRDDVVVTVGDEKLVVTWTNPTDPDYNHTAFSYRVSGDEYGEWSGGGQSQDDSSTAHSIIGLTNGTTYQIRVIAVSNGGEDGTEIIATGTHTPDASAGGGGGSGGGTVPAPTSLTVQDNTANVRLEWVDNASDESGYVIESKKQGSVTWDEIAIIGANAQAFTQNFNIASDTYEYRVKAIRSAESSDYSSVVSVTRSGGGGGGSPQGPIAPADLAAVDNTSNVTLSWNDNSNDETGFVVERRKGGVGDWTEVVTTSANTANYVDNLNIASDTYEYRVKAVKGGSESSAYSNVANVTRSGGGGPPQPPIAPATLSAVDNVSSVALSWDDKSDDETGFAVERSKEGDSTWTTVATTSANATSYEDGFNIASDTYEYRVRAVKNDAESSAYSNIISLTRAIGGGESEDLNLTAIVSGNDSIVLLQTTADTVKTLLEVIAVQTQLNASALLVYLGDMLLDEPNQELGAAGFSDGDQFTVTVAGETFGESYASWQLSALGSDMSDRLPSEDSNEDGFSNFVHYAMGTDPTGAFDSGTSLCIEISNSTFVISYQQRKAAVEASLVLEISVDSMGEWDDAVAFGMSKIVVDSEVAGVEIVSWTYAGDMDGSLMARLRIESP